LTTLSGVYDVAASAMWVNAGTDHDTAAFAVESIRRWWKAMGRAAYPHARRLLVTADAGGFSRYRTRAWKAGLAAFALETGSPSGVPLPAQHPMPLLVGRELSFCDS
jgi:hypothetical protein